MKVLLVTVQNVILVIVQRHVVKVVLATVHNVLLVMTVQNALSVVKTVLSVLLVAKTVRSVNLIQIVHVLKVVLTAHVVSLTTNSE